MDDSTVIDNRDHESELAVAPVEDSDRESELVLNKYTYYKGAIKKLRPDLISKSKLASNITSAVVYAIGGIVAFHTPSGPLVKYLCSGRSSGSTIGPGSFK